MNKIFFSLLKNGIQITEDSSISTQCTIYIVYMYTCINAESVHEFCRAFIKRLFRTTWIAIRILNIINISSRSFVLNSTTFWTVHIPIGIQYTIQLLYRYCTYWNIGIPAENGGKQFTELCVHRTHYNDMASLPSLTRLCSLYKMLHQVSTGFPSVWDSLDPHNELATLVATRAWAQSVHWAWIQVQQVDDGGRRLETEKTPREAKNHTVCDQTTHR